jgi:lambda repressor-like predicted transcriptional regulator
MQGLIPRRSDPHKADGCSPRVASASSSPCRIASARAKVGAVSDAENPLLAAFLGLLPMAAPERQEAILRRALQQVLADPEDQPSRPLVARSPAISAVDRGDWAALKPRIRAELDLAGMSMSGLAEATGIAVSSLQKTLSPAGLVPGRLISDKLQAWLDARAEAAPATETTTPAAPIGTAGNGHAPATTANGARYKLTSAERQELADRLPLIDPRRDLGLSHEAAQRAADGAVMPSEVIARVVDFLAASRGNGAAE